MSVESWIILASWRKFDGRAGFGAYYVNLVRSAGLAGPGRAKCPQSLATVSPSRGRPNGSASRTQPSNTTSRRAFLQSTC